MTVMVLPELADAGTLNDPVMIGKPLRGFVVGVMVATVVVPNVMVVDPVNPSPLMLTVDPGGPEVGLRDRSVIVCAFVFGVVDAAYVIMVRMNSASANFISAWSWFVWCFGITTPSML